MGSGTLRTVWSYARWLLLALVLGVLLIAAFRIPAALQREKSNDLVAQIHAAKITVDDVDGKHLPPSPDPSLKDATIAGVDANQNGIRDDVELAIFAKYPSNTKLRAAALQYALTEQMFLTSVIDTPTWKAVAEENSRANTCVAIVLNNYKSGTDLTDWVEFLLFNTEERRNTRDDVFRFITSNGSAEGEACDIAK